MKEPASIGFIGTGNMGAPMAANIARCGHAVVAFDRNRAAAAATAAVHENIAAAGALDDLATRETIITMLPTGADVAAVLFGDANGPRIAESLASGSLVIDMSSSEPAGTRRLGEKLAGLQIHLVDAPVSGGVARARDASLTIMAGGERQKIDPVLPLLECMGKVYLTGPLGSGHAMKALNNFLSACGTIAASEAVLVGARFGLDPAVMTDILNVSTGRSNATENKLAQHMLSGKFASGFSLKLMDKDVAMARDLAAGLDVSAPTLSLVSRILGDALAQLGDSADHTELYRYIGGLAEENRTTETDT